MDDWPPKIVFPSPQFCEFSDPEIQKLIQAARIPGAEEHPPDNQDPEIPE